MFIDNTNRKASLVKTPIFCQNYFMPFIEKRSSQRYSSIANARISTVKYGEILLKDISVTGCRLESTMQLDITEGTPYKLEIIPEKASSVDEFDIAVELIWTENGGYSTYYGFKILESPKGKLFQRYVDYLAYRSTLSTTP